MAVNGEVELNWADGEYKFNIGKLKCVLELEEKCNAGLAEIANRLSNGSWRYNDIRETLRLGLIGAGEMPDKAMRLINRYCDDRPKAENLPTAQAIILVGMFGVPEDDPLTKKAETERAKEDQSTQPTERSSAPSSMDSVPPSGSTRVN